MKGEIKKMENAKTTFLVLRIGEDKDNGNIEIDVVENFNTMTDAKNYKDAKDCIERLTPCDYWVTSYKIQQIFYKSFVQVEKSA